MVSMIITFLIYLFFALMVNVIEAFPFVIALFRVIRGKGRWGWFIAGVIWKIFLMSGAWRNFLQASEHPYALEFALEQIVGVLLIVLFYLLIRKELKKRDEAEEVI